MIILEMVFILIFLIIIGMGIVFFVSMLVFGIPLAMTLANWLDRKLRLR